MGTHKVYFLGFVEKTKYAHKDIMIKLSQVIPDH